MDDSYESLSEVMKMFVGKDLDRVELILELMARTDAGSYKVKDPTILETLFLEIYALKPIILTPWSISQ